jgi:hypothetical protein
MKCSTWFPLALISAFAMRAAETNAQDLALTADQATAEVRKATRDSHEQVLRAFDAALGAATDPDVAVGIKRRRDAFDATSDLPTYDDLDGATFATVAKDDLFYALKNHRKAINAAAIPLEKQLSPRVAALMQQGQFEAAAQEKQKIEAFRTRYCVPHLYLALTEGAVFKGGPVPDALPGNQSPMPGQVTMTVAKIAGSEIVLDVQIQTLLAGQPASFQTTLKCQYTYSGNKLRLVSGGTSKLRALTDPYGQNGAFQTLLRLDTNTALGAALGYSNGMSNVFALKRQD